jgi:hypothetical protein
MKFISQLFEDFMPKKRGTTKFITTNKVSNWDKYEVLDNVC